MVSGPIESENSKDHILPFPNKPNAPVEKLTPMTPMQASSAVVNLLLGTGPYTYPQGFVALGPVVSSILLFITCIIASITASFMVEAISLANAIDEQRNEDTIFP